MPDTDAGPGDYVEWLRSDEGTRYALIPEYWMSLLPPALWDRPKPPDPQPTQHLVVPDAGGQRPPTGYESLAMWADVYAAWD